MIDETDLSLSRSCLEKVKHRHEGLPRGDASDTFAAWQRSESEKFRAVAETLFPRAQRAGGGSLDELSAETKRLLSAGNAVLQGALTCGDCQCRVDVIEPDGDIVRLYAFVAKPVDFQRHEFGLEFCYRPGRLRSEWRDSIERAAFRARIVQALFPQHRIIPLLVVPVCGLAADSEGLHGALSANETGTKPSPVAVQAAGQLLRVVSIVQECALVAGVVERRVETLRSFLAHPWRRVLSYSCKKCEFRAPSGASGFDRCWGQVRPSMFSLAFMYFIQDLDGQPVANRLAREGRVSLWDIPRELIRGEYAERQLMQLDGTRDGCEIIRPGLSDALSALTYPLHYLDIETLRSWLPPHRGMRVNELVLFQFSVHSRVSPQAELTHQGWLNAEPTNPNRRFLRALRAALGDTGTVCVWTQYEQTSFAELLRDLIRDGIEDEDQKWLRGVLSSGRICDLHELCFRHYFRPAMGGRTAIKAVLPAAWSMDSPVKRRAPYNEFSPDLDPYGSLKAAGTVADGCMAMDAYLDVIGPDRRNSEAAYAALWRYCRIDSLAMSFVVDLWTWRLGEISRPQSVTTSVTSPGTE